ncbi:hypothetical protein BJV74DRAFT_846664 [Russula compacta]|nr:hypothetical protein BJV74DRAFT_846664 [Russula compacta]
MRTDHPESLPARSAANSLPPGTFAQQPASQSRELPFLPRDTSEVRCLYDIGARSCRCRRATKSADIRCGSLRSQKDICVCVCVWLIEVRGAVTTGVSSLSSRRHGYGLSVCADSALTHVPLAGWWEGRLGGLVGDNVNQWQKTSEVMIRARLAGLGPNKEKKKKRKLTPHPRP